MSEIVIYEDGNVELTTVVENESIWLSQKQLCELFGRDKSVVSRHINNIFKREELDKHSVVAKNATTAKDGKTDQVDYYNLDMIISLGYSVKQKSANLLYYVIKGHPFNDGNKRIGAYLFVLFLHKSGILYKTNGEAKINDNALASLALLVATSAPEQKDIIIKLVMNMLVEGE